MKLLPNKQHLQYNCVRYQYGLINFDLSTDKYPLQSVGWNRVPISKLQQCNRWSLGMGTWYDPALYLVYDYLSTLGLKIIRVSNMGSGLACILCARSITLLLHSEEF